MGRFLTVLVGAVVFGASYLLLAGQRATFETREAQSNYQYQGIASSQLLRRVMARVRERSLAVANLDAALYNHCVSAGFPHGRITFSDTPGDDEHRALLDLIQTVEGKVILSGYACPLYDEALSRWWHEDFDLPNNAASGQQKRRMVERIWTNYTPERTT